MKTVKYLLEMSKEIWDKYNKHPFIMGIENGTLKKEKFRYYIIQDFKNMTLKQMCFSQVQMTKFI
ncbi:hypothetical protein, partial [Brachyspira sp.]|uniref:hypothetical protein n=1 Tax=Brachyspira sp. TaxID=1977261 RepID=UPI003D7D94D6